MEESCILHLQKQFQKFSDLYLCHCGRSQCSSLYICGPAVRPNYLIYYILEGGRCTATSTATGRCGRGTGR